MAPARGRGRGGGRGRAGRAGHSTAATEGPPAAEERAANDVPSPAPPSVSPSPGSASRRKTSPMTLEHRSAVSLVRDFVAEGSGQCPVCVQLTRAQSRACGTDRAHADCMKRRETAGANEASRPKRGRGAAGRDAAGGDGAGVSGVGIRVGGRQTSKAPPQPRRRSSKRLVDSVESGDVGDNDQERPAKAARVGGATAAVGAAVVGAEGKARAETAAPAKKGPGNKIRITSSRVARRSLVADNAVLAAGKGKQAGDGGGRGEVRAGARGSGGVKRSGGVRQSAGAKNSGGAKQTGGARQSEVTNHSGAAKIAVGYKPAKVKRAGVVKRTGRGRAGLRGGVGNGTVGERRSTRAVLMPHRLRDAEFAVEMEIAGDIAGERRRARPAGRGRGGDGRDGGRDGGQAAVAIGKPVGVVGARAMGVSGMEGPRVESSVTESLGGGRSGRGGRRRGAGKGSERGVGAGGAEQGGERGGGGDGGDREDEGGGQREQGLVASGGVGAGEGGAGGDAGAGISGGGVGVGVDDAYVPERAAVVRGGARGGSRGRGRGRGRGGGRGGVGSVTLSRAEVEGVLAQLRESLKQREDAGMGAGVGVAEEGVGAGAGVASEGGDGMGVGVRSAEGGGGAAVVVSGNGVPMDSGVGGRGGEAGGVVGLGEGGSGGGGAVGLVEQGAGEGAGVGLVEEGTGAVGGLPVLPPLPQSLPPSLQPSALPPESLPLSVLGMLRRSEPLSAQPIPQSAQLSQPMPLQSAPLSDAMRPSSPPPQLQRMLDVRLQSTMLPMTSQSMQQSLPLSLAQSLLGVNPYAYSAPLQLPSPLSLHPALPLPSPDLPNCVGLTHPPGRGQAPARVAAAGQATLQLQPATPSTLAQAPVIAPAPANAPSLMPVTAPITVPPITAPATAPIPASTNAPIPAPSTPILGAAVGQTSAADVGRALPRIGPLSADVGAGVSRALPGGVGAAVGRAVPVGAGAADGNALLWDKGAADSTSGALGMSGTSPVTMHAAGSGALTMAGALPVSASAAASEPLPMPVGAAMGGASPISNAPLSAVPVGMPGNLPAVGLPHLPGLSALSRLSGPGQFMRWQPLPGTQQQPSAAHQQPLLQQPLQPQQSLPQLSLPQLPTSLPLPSQPQHNVSSQHDVRLSLPLQDDLAARVLSYPRPEATVGTVGAVGVSGTANEMAETALARPIADGVFGPEGASRLAGPEAAVGAAQPLPATSTVAGRGAAANGPLLAGLSMAGAGLAGTGVTAHGPLTVGLTLPGAQRGRVSRGEWGSAGLGMGGIGGGGAGFGIAGLSVGGGIGGAVTGIAGLGMPGWSVGGAGVAGDRVAGFSMAGAAYAGAGVTDTVGLSMAGTGVAVTGPLTADGDGVGFSAPHRLPTTATHPGHPTPSTPSLILPIPPPPTDLSSAFSISMGQTIPPLPNALPKAAGSIAPLSPLPPTSALQLTAPASSALVSSAPAQPLSMGLPQPSSLPTPAPSLPPAPAPQLAPAPLPPPPAPLLPHNSPDVTRIVSSLLQAAAQAAVDAATRQLFQSPPLPPHLSATDAVAALHELNELQAAAQALQDAVGGDWDGAGGVAGIVGGGQVVGGMGDNGALMLGDGRVQSGDAVGQLTDTDAGPGSSLVSVADAGLLRARLQRAVVARLARLVGLRVVVDEGDGEVGRMVGEAQRVTAALRVAAGWGDAGGGKGGKRGGVGAAQVVGAERGAAGKRGKGAAASAIAAKAGVGAKNKGVGGRGGSHAMVAKHKRPASPLSLSPPVKRLRVPVNVAAVLEGHSEEGLLPGTYFFYHHKECPMRLPADVPLPPLLRHEDVQGTFEEYERERQSTFEGYAGMMQSTIGDETGRQSTFEEDARGGQSTMGDETGRSVGLRFPLRSLHSPRPISGPALCYPIHAWSLQSPCIQAVNAARVEAEAQRVPLSKNTALRYPVCFDPNQRTAVRAGWGRGVEGAGGSGDRVGEVGGEGLADKCGEVQMGDGQVRDGERCDEDRACGDGQVADGERRCWDERPCEEVQTGGGQMADDDRPCDEDRPCVDDDDQPCPDPCVASLGRGMRSRQGVERAVNDRDFRNLLASIRSNSTAFNGRGSVLRLKNFMNARATPRDIDALLDALWVNTRVQILYIQNFNAGMLDPQLRKLVDTLATGRVWAVNVGENMQTSLAAWEEFADRLPLTNIGYTYVSEHHINQVKHLKDRIIYMIRMNRKHFETHGGRVRQRDYSMIKSVSNMWYNPRTEKEKREIDEREREDQERAFEASLIAWPGVEAALRVACMGQGGDRGGVALMGRSGEGGGVGGMGLGGERGWEEGSREGNGVAGMGQSGGVAGDAALRVAGDGLGGEGNGGARSRDGGGVGGVAGDGHSNGVGGNGEGGGVAGDGVALVGHSNGVVEPAVPATNTDQPPSSLIHPLLLDHPQSPNQLASLDHPPLLDQPDQPTTLSHPQLLDHPSSLPSMGHRERWMRYVALSSPKMRAWAGWGR